MIGHVIIWVSFFLFLFGMIKFGDLSKRPKSHPIWGWIAIGCHFGFYISIIGVIISCYALAAKLFLFLI